MKKLSALVLFLSVAFVAQEGSAARLRPYTQLDYWTRDGAYNGAKDSLKEQLAQDRVIAGPGVVMPGRVSADVHAGWGGRLGLLVEPLPGWEFGGNIGYVAGPRGDVNSRFDLIEPLFSTTEVAILRRTSEQYKTSFWRLMLEGRKRFRLGRGLSLGLGAGAGVARGKLEKDRFDLLHANPLFFPFPDIVTQESNSKSWTGFTWEAGPSLVYAGSSIDLELGVVYAAFPTMKRDDAKSLSEFKWNPIGVRLAAMFGGTGDVEPAGERLMKIFTAVEYWTAANAYEEVEDLWNADIQLFEAGTMSSKVSAGKGLRLGVLFPTSLKDFHWGGSIGYVVGPEATFDVFEADSTVSFDQRDAYKTRYVRVLTEVRKGFPLSDRVAVRLGAGVGVGRGRIDEEFNCTPTGFGSCSDVSWSDTSVGLTYEAGPSIVYTGPIVNVELAVVYAGFPKLDVATDSGIDIDATWNPIGVRLGMEF